MEEEIITREFLRAHPECVFVFGDNLLRTGRGGAAALRDEPNTFGFITKKAPDNEDDSFYTPEAYQDMFDTELKRLEERIITEDKIFLISRIGAGLANRYGIWEEIIKPVLEEKFDHIDNVKLLWRDKL